MTPTHHLCESQEHKNVRWAKPLSQSHHYIQVGLEEPETNISENFEEIDQKLNSKQKPSISAESQKNVEKLEEKQTKTNRKNIEITSNNQDIADRGGENLTDNPERQKTFLDEDGRTIPKSDKDNIQKEGQLPNKNMNTHISDEKSDQNYNSQEINENVDTESEDTII